MKSSNKIFRTKNNISFPEKEFLERELGIKIVKGLPSKDKSTKKLIFLASNNILELENIFNSAAKDQIVLLWLGNETYDLNLYKYAQKYSEKINHIFLFYYPLQPTKKSLCKMYLGALIDKSYFYRWGRVNGFRVTKNGLDLIQRTKVITKQKNVTAVPLGYTNVFVRQFKHYFPNLSPRESLLTYRTNVIGIKKTIDVSFFGKEGEWGRHFALYMLLKADLNKVIKIKTNGWGGDKFRGVEFFDSMLRSKFVLAAPGHISNQSFRYLESLLSGALPLTPPSTLQDPHNGNFWTANLKKIKFYSWRYLVEVTTQIPEDYRLTLIEDALTEVKSQIQLVKAKLANF